MSQENVEIVRQVIESNRSGDLEGSFEASLALWDPSCEYRGVTAVVDRPTYRGHEGLRRYKSDMANAWAEWRGEAEDLVEVGPDIVVATVRARLSGKASGVRIEEHFGAVFVLSRGKILRAQLYPSRKEALESVGRPE